MNRIIALIIIALTTSLAYGQETATGPITDLIEKRINARFDVAEGRLSEVLDNIKELRAERQGILEQLIEMRGEREGILKHLAEIREERGTILARLSALRQEVSDSVGKWTPVQDAIDRLMGLVWKLFLLVGMIGGLLLLIALIVAVSYARLKAFFVNALDL
jgi:hypothetical protein